MRSSRKTGSMTWSRTVVSARPPKAPLTESRPSTCRALPDAPSPSILKSRARVPVRFAFAVGVQL